jgi:hypothetical protein
MKESTSLEAPTPEVVQAPIIKCGIIMPISSIGDYGADHWKGVLKILKEVVSELGYACNLVSDADDSGIIQKRIIQNLYDNEIVICDVSGKNPNVMFELGIRLAFDKPTIIIKDDCTDYSFDTSIIEHLTYPRNLTYWQMVDFKKSLNSKIVNTIKAAESPQYSTFLKNFGEFKIAKLETQSVTQEEFFVNALNDLRREVISLKRSSSIVGSRTYDKLDMDDEEIKRQINTEVERFNTEVPEKHIDFFCSEDDIRNFVNYLSSKNHPLIGKHGRIQIREMTRKILNPF